VSLFTALPAQALDLSLALFMTISNDKIAKLEPADEEGGSSWEAVQTAIFSGILVGNRFQASLSFHLLNTFRAGLHRREHK
jgi:hypothetical protein